MTTILDKARQVAADALTERGFRATADAVIKNLPVRHQPSEYVCAVLDALSAANLLAREPRELTDAEIMQRWNKMHIGTITPTSGVMQCIRDLISQSYPDYATKEKELTEAKAKIAELTAKLESVCESMGCPPDDDPIHWGKILHETLDAANELRCENKEQAEEIERLEAALADQQASQLLFEKQSGQIFYSVVAERDQLRIDNEQLRGELANACKIVEDRGRLRLLLAEAHGWIKSYRLGEGDGLQQRIELAIGIGQAVHRTSVPTGRSTETKPLLADAVLCFEEWKELSAQRQWELFQAKRKHEVRLQTIVTWCAWNTDWADQLQSSTQWSTEDDLVAAMCKAIICSLHSGISKGDIK